MHNLYRGKKVAQNVGYVHTSAIKKIPPKNYHPSGEFLPNLVTLLRNKAYVVAAFKLGAYSFILLEM
jgi:hypothetical protein